MKNKLTMLSVFLLLLGLNASPATANMDTDDHAMGETTAPATLESLEAAPSAAEDGSINMNNALCPVSGDKTSEKNIVTHDGVNYRLCCPMCAAKIEKNPSKYTVSKAVIMEKIAH